MDQNPILIVDDDSEDLEMINHAWSKLKVNRPIHFFKNGDELVAYLESTSSAPFVILCDMNLPGETGFDIKKRISEDEKLKYQSVPFIFWSTAASKKQIQYAYDLPAQGFFLKPSNFQDLCDTFETILGYWQKSLHPKPL